MKLSSVKFTIGVGKDKDGSSITEIAAPAIAMVCIAIADAFGGYTKTKGFGGWVDSNKKLVEEPVVIIEAAVTNGLRYETTGDIRQEAQRIVDLAKDLLKQECILVQYIAGNSGLA